MTDYRCELCGGSYSLPLGATCADHRPVPIGGRPARTATAIRFSAETHAALVKAAEERQVSINWLVNRAVEDFLPRLVPIEEMRWTR